MSEELRPCPFCGSEQPKDVKGDGNVPYEFGMSRSCRFCGATVMHDWNTRPIEDALTARIAGLEAERRWIPVSERLPEPYEKVIALAKDCMNVDWVLPKELREVGKGAFARLYNVTHWMPLPEPPVMYGKVCEE